jgi:prepilin-type N-terminal cleavage/methylation domain-containing protein
MKKHAGYSLLEIIVVLTIIVGLFAVAGLFVLRYQKGKRGQVEAAMLDARNQIRSARNAARIGLTDLESRTFDATRMRLPQTVRVVTKTTDLPVAAPVVTRCVFEPQSTIVEPGKTPEEGWGLIVLTSDIEGETAALLVTKRSGPVLIFKRYGTGPWRRVSNLLN